MQVVCVCGYSVCVCVCVCVCVVSIHVWVCMPVCARTEDFLSVCDFLCVLVIAHVQQSLKYACTFVVFIIRRSCLRK